MTLASPADTIEALPDAVDQHGFVCSTATGPVGRMLASILGLRPRCSQPARLRIGSVDPADPNSPARWTRTFGRRSWTTIVEFPADGQLVERAGVSTLRYDVELVGDRFGPERLELELAGLSVGPIRLDRYRPVSISAVVVPGGDATTTTVTIDVGRLGCVTYVAAMRDGGVS